MRGVARTAVIAGTATAASYAVGSAIDKHQQGKAQEQAAEAGAYQEPVQYEPSYQTAEPPAAAGSGDDITTQLQRLVELRQSGLLTDEEFAAAKAKLLAS